MAGASYSWHNWEEDPDVSVEDIEAQLDLGRTPVWRGAAAPLWGGESVEYSGDPESYIPLGPGGIAKYVKPVGTGYKGLKLYDIGPGEWREGAERFYEMGIAPERNLKPGNAFIEFFEGVRDDPRRPIGPGIKEALKMGPEVRDYLKRKLGYKGVEFYPVESDMGPMKGSQLSRLRLYERMLRNKARKIGKVRGKESDIYEIPFQESP